MICRGLQDELDVALGAQTALLGIRKGVEFFDKPSIVPQHGIGADRLQMRTKSSVNRQIQIEVAWRGFVIALRGRLLHRFFYRRISRIIV